MDLDKRLAVVEDKLQLMPDGDLYRASNDELCSFQGLYHCLLCVIKATDVTTKPWKPALDIHILGRARRLRGVDIFKGLSRTLCILRSEHSSSCVQSFEGVSRLVININKS